MVRDSLQTSRIGRKSFLGQSTQIGLLGSGEYKRNSLKGRLPGWDKKDKKSIFKGERLRRHKSQLRSEGMTF